jgi:hypothetical protein
VRACHATSGAAGQAGCVRAVTERQLSSAARAESYCVQSAGRISERVGFAAVMRMTPGRMLCCAAWLYSARMSAIRKMLREPKL